MEVAALSVGGKRLSDNAYASLLPMGYVGSRDFTLGDLIDNQDNFFAMHAACAAMKNPCGPVDTSIQGIATNNAPYIAAPWNVMMALRVSSDGDLKGGTATMSSALGDIPVYGQLVGPLGSIAAYGMPDTPIKVRTGLAPGEQFYSRLDDGTVVMKDAVDRGDAYLAKRDTNWQLHSVAIPLPATLLMEDVDDNVTLVDDLQNIGAIWC